MASRSSCPIREEAVRYMALVPRFTRRLLGKSILEVYEKGRDKPRFTRSFLPGNFSADGETGSSS
jgi:hypothetical protein